MTWFERLTGFAETTPEVVRSRMSVDGPLLRAADRAWKYGRLEIPSLAELRDAARSSGTAPTSPTRVRELVADVQTLHADPSNAGAVFQVASQFNLLEMVGPSVTPEQGVSQYESDPTQGPACAIACGAGTIYRNYFMPLNGESGQTADRQVDCSACLEAALRGGRDRPLWKTRNGYALPDAESLAAACGAIGECGEAERDALRATVRVGVQSGTQVTLPGCDHTVTQVFCSAMPVSYSEHTAAAWEPLARLTLEATYEATLLTARREGAGRPVFLTLVGGGAFGNRTRWIEDAIVRAVQLVDGLDVRIVSYGRPNRSVAAVIDRVDALP